MKTGMRGGSLKILSDEDAERLHQAALSLLADPGLYSESDLFLDIFAKGGARVDREARTIRLPAEMVMAADRIGTLRFVLHGRHDEANSLLLEPGRVYYGMGGTSEPHVLGLHAVARPPAHQAGHGGNSTRLGHALPNIDFVQTLCMSGDLPTGQIFFHDFDAIFRNTSKPTVINILERPFTQQLLEMAAAASGGEEALRDTQRAGDRHAGHARSRSPS